MTSAEIVQLVIAALAGGILTKIANPIISLITAGAQGRKIDAETMKVEAEAIETPFRQAAWIITDLRERVKMLEQDHDADRKQQENLLTHLAECERKNALLSQRILKLEQAKK